ncbi:hypothetical protein [Streptacidiphilus sp. P02-A3a]|uniref:hypothetical protein n=1 Tax=Streptacidiphilus sp. P02-A3a TaxID=2704468 RepID=UPI0015F80596|nr:hypothetical protein [Streptacidiphilus sp. P02-A3a]QMU68112.1 hypothetical protein GXP74_07630 [Streptacidiphilus sp. P02-A3a]
MTQNDEISGQGRMNVLVSSVAELAKAVEGIRASVSDLTELIGVDPKLRSGFSRVKRHLPSKLALDSISKELAAISAAKD